MEHLTNTEMAILGLTAEGPRHGYQLEQDIEQRGMRAWTEIGFSSIYYVLNKLEKAGLLASQRVAGSAQGAVHGGPARRVYHLTGAGQEALRDAVLARLAQPRPRSGDFDLALANLPALEPHQALAALRAYRQGLAERRAAVEQKQAADRAGMQQAGLPFPEHVEALFSHSLALMQAELEWIDSFLPTLEKTHANPQGR